MKRHILIISYRDIRHPQWGGAEVIIYEIFRRIQHQGYKISFLCGSFPGGPSRDEIDGMQIYRVGNLYNFNFKAALFLRSMAAREKIDLVVEDINKIPFYSPLFVKNTPTLCIVPHLFGTTVFKEAPFLLAAYVYLYEQFIPRIYKRSHFSALSGTTRDDLISRGIPQQHIHLIRSGIDHDLHVPPSERPSSPEPIFLYLGRLKKYKRIELPILAMPTILKTVPKAQYWIVGDGDYRPQLEELTTRMGLKDSVRFLGMRMGRDKLDLLHKSRILVYTSPKEGWGLSVIEANATGCVAVASNSPGLRESVRHEETGLLVPHGDVKALAAALIRLLTDNQLWLRMSREGVKWAGEFHWEKSTRETLNLIEHVIGSPAVP
ncbi:MAG: glycosyltransferase family 4 protein [Candidatus Eisenbacteria bacterium]|uniref:Glycosyltransferase family 4 protein n=1 Tax=Eiseniibacteriota bacterium TaxID=2212470 RepID=A0A948S0J9_UNCEI|nr:glycosyltransferase family 4 protein [Candidatus Eisenbacteria bacterium]MBU1950395.1 glycosyltransferase family 4 protein [Candidatus Eisenbacteria bacterium]MBU2692984.1 glycosyltransferase family 4 protein [Candidatus Eisenbacteria bacterium]